MIQYVYAVHDIHTGYNLPFYAPSDGAARRSYETSCIEEPILRENKSDFQLRKIGMFDTETGVIVGYDPEVIA